MISRYLVIERVAVLPDDDILLDSIYKNWFLTNSENFFQNGVSAETGWSLAKLLTLRDG